MSIWLVTALGTGAVVGAGIFALLGQIALVAVDETHIAFLLAGLAAALSGFTYAKLAAHHPDAGGITAYFDHAFGAHAAISSGGQIWINTFASGIVIILTSMSQDRDWRAKSKSLWSGAFRARHRPGDRRGVSKPRQRSLLSESFPWRPLNR